MADERELIEEREKKAAEIRALKFDAPTQIRSIITEIDTLARTMATMKSTIHRFLEMGAALAGERNFERLLDASWLNRWKSRRRGEAQFTCRNRTWV